MDMLTISYPGTDAKDWEKNGKAIFLYFRRPDEGGVFPVEQDTIGIYITPEGARQLIKDIQRGLKRDVNGKTRVDRWRDRWLGDS